MQSRYSLSNLFSAVKDPSKFVTEAKRIISKAIFETKYGNGVNVMSEDWDNLIILDACRADFFAEYNDIDGDLRTAVSKASNSEGFIDANFAGRELHDTVLVTANPFVEQLSDDVFYRVYYSDLLAEWDEDLKTVPPGAVVDAAAQMHEQHSNKRLIVHMMQPHAPYIGPTGRDLYDRYKFGVFNPAVKDSNEFNVPDQSVPQAVKDGPIQEAELRQAYAENVEIAVDHAAELVEQLNGKSVVTADHGELLGERVFATKRYGHPGTISTQELRVVPWLVIEGQSRRDITSGQPSGFERLGDDIRDSRLRALGYA